MCVSKGHGEPHEDAEQMWEQVLRTSLWASLEGYLEGARLQARRPRRDEVCAGTMGMGTQMDE